MTAKLDSRFIVNLQSYRNRIINGDFSVAQRGDSHILFNENKYTIDRVNALSAGYYLLHRRGKVYAPDEGSLATVLDIFNDGSCVALYRFEGNANDDSGNHNGTWNGNEQYGNGMFGQAASFDGSSYIDTGIDPSSVLGSTCTISHWIRPLDSQSYRDSIGFHDASNHSGFTFQYDDDHWDFLYGNGSDWVYLRLPDVRDGNWYHLVVVFDSDAIKVYVNGELISKHDGNDYVPANQLWIGKGYDDTNRFFKGLIDQVRIFNRALTDDEVKVLYTESNNHKRSSFHFIDCRIIDEDTSASNKYIHPFVYRFEGQHLYDLAILGKKVTLSLEFASNKNGDYSLSLRNRTNGVIDSYIKKFSYSSSGEFQKFSFVFDLSEFPQRFENDENVGFELIIGSNNPSYEAPSEGLHTNTDYHYLANTNQFSLGDWFKIRKIQLEEGDRATEFEYVPYEVQLIRCLRYLYFVRRSPSGGLTIAKGYWYDGTHAWVAVKLLTRFRAVPSLYYSSSSHFKLTKGSGPASGSVTSINLDNSSPDIVNLTVSYDTDNNASGQGTNLYIEHVNGWLMLDAEL